MRAWLSTSEGLVHGAQPLSPPPAPTVVARGSTLVLLSVGALREVQEK